MKRPERCRLRVLVSAFACAPGRGSEPGAGWTWVRAAADSADVVLLTERWNEEALTAELTARPLPTLRVVYVDVHAVVARVSVGDRRIRLRHLVWQRAAARVAAGLHAEDPFDLVHHLTLSADWQPVGVAGLLHVPFVWGPVGGACPLPWRLHRYLSPAALAGEVARGLAGAAGRRWLGDRVAARSTTVLCQNDHVARRFGPRTTGRVVVEPNVAIQRPTDVHAGQVPPTADGVRDAVFVGRLLDWKGLRLAVAAVSQPAASPWQLTVIGEGPGRAGAIALAGELGVLDRVRFLGALPHADVLDRLARADALLFPSTHEACGWVVAEALSVGCPPVVLDVGGPPVLVRRAGLGTCVPVTGDPAPALARALGALPRDRPAPSPEFDVDRLPALIASCYADAVARGPVGAP